MAISLRVPLLLCLATACGFPRPPDVAPDAEVLSCTANEFVACNANILQTCNTIGDGTTTQDCGVAGCNADAKRCNQCVPATSSCGANPNELEHCGPDGLPAASDTCALACTATTAPHCPYLEPRYLPDVCDAVATMPTFTVSNSANFDTGLDSGCTGGILLQDGGPDICVVRYGAIHITQSGTLTVKGTRAVALVADSEVVLEGRLYVNASEIQSGPGGGKVVSGDGPSEFASAGGGAGFATAGGAGGSPTVNGGGGRGGGQATDPALVTVLLGGSCSQGLRGGCGGGGGGAATLIACRGQLLMSGTINAGGGGGFGGFRDIAFNIAGTGGGAGGNVVLQGLSIAVTGQVFANGGGGGAGIVVGGAAGQSGSDGTLSTTIAAAGGASLSSEGAGGAGGLQGTMPGIGLHPTTDNGRAGGGGGSVGFFQTYTPTGVAPVLAPSAASPSFGANKLVMTR